MKFITALRDPELFGTHFQGPSYRAWKMVARVISNVKLSPREVKVFRQVSQRKKVPRALLELCLILGRRSGKSKFAAALALYLVCFRDWSKALSVGEVGTGMIICPDRKQGRVVKRYMDGFIKKSPLLKSMVLKVTSEAIHFTNNTVIEIHTASYRSVRGYSVIFCILDELAFFRDENSANPDREILAALRPSMATIPDPLLISLSTPYARKGVVWDYYNRYFGKDDNQVLVLNAATEIMNPRVSARVIRDAYEEDPISAKAEYGAEFRKDIESFVSQESVDAVTIASRLELSPLHNLRYVAFVDPSGGSGQDSMTLAIAHREEDKAVLDLVRERKPPFSPETTVKEFCKVLQSYRIRVVTGDKWGGDFVREPFRKKGIAYRLSDMPKSEIYGNFLPLLNSSKIELLDHPKLKLQLLNLERRTHSGGRDSIDHPAGPWFHDDIINCAAGAIVTLARASRQLRSFVWPDRQRRSKPKVIPRIVKWHNLDLIPNDQAFTLNCYFCNDVLRTYKTHPGKILPDDDCRQCGTDSGRTWYVQCRACFKRMQTESPRKMQIAGRRRRRENSLVEAAREGRIKQHEFGILL